MIEKSQVAGLMVLLAFAAAGCAGQQDGAAEESAEAGSEPKKEYRRATAYINPRSGSEASGSAIFFYDGNKGTVELQIEIEGAPPGTHAFHLHELGDCSAEDGSSAGGHWNPTEHDHGRWGGEAFHLGDVGNIEVGKDGKGSFSLTTDKWAVGTGGPNDVVGRSVILHEKADDFTTQPTGAAGGRIGCGVINAG